MSARLLCAVLLVCTIGCKTRQPDDAARPDVQQRGPPPPAGAAPEPPRTGQLARVRPPAPPCLDRRGAPVTVLLARSAELFERGDHVRALACADEALRADARLVPALHRRASALAALGRKDEARFAFSRALAIDPDDAETLLGAADLYVARSAGDHESLLLGLDHAQRGVRAAQARDDRDLAARLLVVAAMAENDLGRSREALRDAERAIAVRPGDAAAHYERGVALYELVRFEEARAALERALELAPEDPWTMHYLALVAEHEGRGEVAQRLEAQARARSPRDFRGVEISRGEFEVEVRRAVALLPREERAALERAPLEIADVPSLDDLTAVEPPLSPAILGLFRGPPEQEACDPADAEPCRSIVLYRLNLARFARDRAELSEQVRVTLLHELGHLHGEDDDELRARGLD